MDFFWDFMSQPKHMTRTITHEKVVENLEEYVNSDIGLFWKV